MRMTAMDPHLSWCVLLMIYVGRPLADRRLYDANVASDGGTSPSGSAHQ